MSRRGRVLVLTTTLPAVPGDGTPEFVLDLATGVASDFDVTIVAPRVPGGRRVDRFGDIRVRRFRYFPGRWERLAHGAILPNLRASPALLIQLVPLCIAYLVAASRAVMRQRPDVVHAHWILPGGAVAALVRAVTGLPYIVSIHGADGYALRSRLAKRVKAAVVERATVALPVSRDLADIVGLGPDVSVVPMGVNGRRVATVVGQRDPRPGAFLYVGRLAEKKGVDVLLRALAAVPDATLTVVGDGPLNAELRGQSRSLDLDGRVVFTGTLPRERVWEHFRRAAALVVPSKVAADGDQDGTPVVIAEAMAAGVPVIASALGGIADVVRDGETGILTQPGSEEDLAKALRRAVEDPTRLEDLGAVARAEFDTSPLNLDTTARAYAQHLADAMRSNAPAPR